MYDTLGVKKQMQMAGYMYNNSQLLPQDRAASREKGQPLCMAQYQRLFASYRMPGLEQDQLKSFPPPDENEHIIVAYRGQVSYYSFSFWYFNEHHNRII